MNSKQKLGIKIAGMSKRDLVKFRNECLKTCTPPSVTAILKEIKREVEFEKLNKMKKFRTMSEIQDAIAEIKKAYPSLKQGTKDSIETILRGRNLIDWELLSEDEIFAILEIVRRGTVRVVNKAHIKKLSKPVIKSKKPLKLGSERTYLKCIKGKDKTETNRNLCQYK